ncbi:Cyanovirin-N [Mariannaea sp. PMI_226]|nr:Cyanovirin-N [Mariannaea sp. PMI_226]
MSFQHTAQNIYLQDGHILRARLEDFGGNWVDAEIDLNNYIGNNYGSFEWGGAGFANSAESISLSLEGQDSVPILRANLKDGHGNAIPRDINLAERIGNIDGHFKFRE